MKYCPIIKGECKGEECMFSLLKYRGITKYNLEPCVITDIGSSLFILSNRGEGAVAKQEEKCPNCEMLFPGRVVQCNKEKGSSIYRCAKCDRIMGDEIIGYEAEITECDSPTGMGEFKPMKKGENY